jgi:opacity protein-like surface antigen
MKAYNTVGMGALALFVSTAALAQPGTPEDGEISAYGGMAAGSLGNHPAVGSSFGRAFSRYCIALIDTSYTPLGSRTLLSYPGVVTDRSRLYDFNFSMHIRVPVQEKWAPYAIVGGGFLFNTYEKLVTNASGATVFEGKSHAAFGFETGGGARYYVTEEWGVRAEVRYTISNHNFARVLGGVFYQFNGDFPLVRRRGRRHHADSY